MHDLLHTAAADARRELETRGILDASSAPTPERIRDGVERADTVTRTISRLLALGAAWATPEQIPAFAAKEPITTAFSEDVGQVLAELPAGAVPRPQYRFYM